MSRDNYEDYEEVELDVITLEDEDGNEKDFAIEFVFEVDGETYASLCPINGDVVDDEDISLWRYEEDEDGMVEISEIETEEEAEKVAKEYELLCAE